MKSSWMLGIWAALALAGCKMEGAGEVAEKPDTLQADVDARRAIADSLAQASARAEDETLQLRPIMQVIERRRTAGDTTPWPVDNLKTYAVGAFDGFVASPVESQIIDLPENNTRMHSIHYTLRKGPQIIQVTLKDLVGNPAQLSSLWKLHQNPMHVDSRNQFTRNYKPKENVFGYENIKRNQNTANLSLLIGNRFHLMLDATGMAETETLKRLAARFNLAELAAASRIQ